VSRSTFCIDLSASLATVTLIGRRGSAHQSRLTNHSTTSSQKRTTNGPRRSRYASLGSCVRCRILSANKSLSFDVSREKYDDNNMTSSKSFYVDALILGKHRHRHHLQQQQPQEERDRQNDNMMLQLPFLHHSLTPVSPMSLPVFRFCPYISRGGSSSSEVRRRTDTWTGRLPCLAATTGQPTCLCPFCLPLTATADTFAVSLPVRDQLETSTDPPRLSVRDTPTVTASPTLAQRRGWQPWLQETTASESLLQSTPPKTEPADRPHHHQLTITGSYRRSSSILT